MNQVFSSEKSCTWRSAISSNGVISGCSITNRLECHFHPVSSTGYTRVGTQKGKELLIRYTKRYLLLFNHQGPSKFNQKKREPASCRPPQGIYAEMQTSRHLIIISLARGTCCREHVDKRQTELADVDSMQPASRPTFCLGRIALGRHYRYQAISGCHQYLRR